MIWALLALYFFGGGGMGSGAILTSSAVGDLTQQVETLIEDKTRRKAAARTLKNLKRDVKSFEKAFSKSGRELDKLYLDHANHEDAALELLEALDAEWARGQRRAIDARFELRDMLTEEEWSIVFGSGG
jgi:hypothetical protein